MYCTGARTAQGLVDTGLDEVKKMAKARLSGKKGSSGGSGGGSGGGSRKEVILMDIKLS